MTDLPKLEDFPHMEHDKLRYGDADMLGHINNAAYTTFLETGRAALLSHPEINAWGNERFTFVIARLELDYRAEVRWPGTIQIGTAVKSIGNSSIVLQQALYHQGACVVTAQSVMVQVDKHAHRPAPISAETRAVLQRFVLKERA